MPIPVPPQNRETIPEGVYTAQVSDVRTVMRPNFDDPSIQEECLEVVFEIVDEDPSINETQLKKRMSLTNSPRSTLRRAAIALLGNENAERPDFDAEWLQGHRCMVTVAHRQTDTGLWMNIDSFAPVRTAPRAASVPPPSAPSPMPSAPPPPPPPPTPPSRADFEDYPEDPTGKTAVVDPFERTASAKRK